MKAILLLFLILFSIPSYGHHVCSNAEARREAEARFDAIEVLEVKFIKDSDYWKVLIIDSKGEVVLKQIPLHC